MRKLHSAIILFLLIGTLLGCQNKNSETKELATVPFKTEEVDLLLEKSKKYHSSDPMRALNYAEEALEKAESIKYILGQSSAHGILAGLYTFKFKDKAKADYHFSLYEGLATEISQLEEKGLLMYRSAIKLYEEDNYSDALAAFVDSHATLEELEALDKLVYVHYAISLMFRRVSKYDYAERHFNEAFKMIESLEDESFVKSLYKMRARNFMNNEDYELAEKYFLSSLEFVDSVNLPLVYSYLITVNYNQSKYSDSKKYFKKGVELADQLNDQKAKGILYLNFSKHYLHKNDYDSVDYFLDKSIETLLPVASSFYLASAYKNKGNFLIEMKKYSEAEEFAEKALMLTGNISLDNKIELLELAIEAEMAQQKHREAFDHQQQLDLLKAENDKSKYIEELTEAYEQVKHKLVIPEKRNLKLD